MTLPAQLWRERQQSFVSLQKSRKQSTVRPPQRITLVRRPSVHFRHVVPLDELPDIFRIPYSAPERYSRLDRVVFLQKSELQRKQTS